MNDDEDFELDLPKSKSQLKREAHEAQDLGTNLVNLPDKKLKKIPMPDDLLAAIMAARKITAHGGLNRQLQYIGKIMRKMDVEEIRTAYDKIVSDQQTQTESFHLLEAWRDRLVNEGNDAVTEFMNLYPQTDAQHLRQLVRMAQKEIKENKPPKNKRALFKYITSLV